MQAVSCKDFAFSGAYHLFSREHLQNRLKNGMIYCRRIIRYGENAMNTKTTVITPEELQEQFAFCDRIAAFWSRQGRTPTAYVETYGCQQNEADSEKIRGYLAQ